MRISHAGAAVALVLLEVGLAPLGVTVHGGFLAEYGDVSDSAEEGLLSVFSTGVVGPALVLVTVAVLVAVRTSSKRWLRVMAETIPSSCWWQCWASHRRH